MKDIQLILTRRVKYIITIASLFVTSATLHLQFAITKYFGEQDSTRLALALIKSIHNNKLQGDGYIPFSTPLYIKFFYQALEHGWIEIANLPATMTYVSIISSSVVTICSFIIVILLTNSYLSAITSSIVLQFNPAFFVNSIYGFPSIVSLSIFMASLAIYYISWNREANKRITLISISLFLYIVSVMTKVDAVMATAAFFYLFLFTVRKMVKELSRH